MDSISDFEEILEQLAQHKVRYLIVGGLAFIFHARPRYTKDIDLLIDPNENNILKANKALADFGAPELLEESDVRNRNILQIGVAPNRIDLLLEIEGLAFEKAWDKRVRAPYGRVMANWVDLDTLLEIKSRINDPRHQDDARLLRKVKELRKKPRRRK